VLWFVRSRCYYVVSCAMASYIIPVYVLHPAARNLLQCIGVVKSYEFTESVEAFVSFVQGLESVFFNRNLGSYA